MPGEPLQADGGYTLAELVRMIGAANKAWADGLAALGGDVRALGGRLDDIVERFDRKYQPRDLAQAAAESMLADLRELAEQIDTLTRAISAERESRQKQRDVDLDAARRQRERDLDAQRQRDDAREKERRAINRWLAGAFIAPIITAVITALILAVVLG